MSDIVSSAALKILPVLVTEAFSERRRARSALFRRRRTAARRLASDLSDLRRLMQKYEKTERYARSVSIRLRSLWSCHQEVAYLLPGGWHHIMRGTRESIGEALGGVGASAWDETFICWPVSDYSLQWQQNSENYIAYVLTRLRQWEVNPSDWAGRRLKPLSFDAWLAERQKSPLTAW